MKFLLDHDVPDDLSYLLRQLGHGVTLLRTALPRDSSDEAVFRFAREADCRVVIVIRRRTRGQERVALFRLLDRAGETPLKKILDSRRSSWPNPTTRAYPVHRKPRSAGGLDHKRRRTVSLVLDKIDLCGCDRGHAGSFCP